MKDGPLVLTITDFGSTRTIAARGELDLSNAGALERKLAEIDGAEAIMLDLEALEFIDSTGLAVLVNAHKRLADGGAGLRIVPSRSNGVCRIFAATGLDKALSFVEPPTG